MRLYRVTRIAAGLKFAEDYAAISEFDAAKQAARGELEYVGGNGEHGYYRDSHNDAAMIVEFIQEIADHFTVNGLEYNRVMDEIGRPDLKMK